MLNMNHINNKQRIIPHMNRQVVFTLKARVSKLQLPAYNKLSHLPVVQPVDGPATDLSV